ncbi:MAG: cytochrome c, partial [Myxococcota bacterium]
MDVRISRGLGLTAFLSWMCVIGCVGDLAAVETRAPTEAAPPEDNSDPVVAPPSSEPPVNPPPSEPPPPPATQPPAAPASGTGILGCPTIEPPAYTLGAAPTLSEAFATACSACHGATGQGRPLYPQLPGNLSEAAFIAKVREGSGEGMPAFSTQSISDATLRYDYAALTLLTSQGTASAGPFGNEWTWSEAEVAQARDEGLAAWRKPDPEGVACADCHTEDALDLAVLGYPDDAITRRGRLHLEPDDVAKLVRYVHAQRRHFGIDTPCAPTYRPLQPGGEVLPGETPEAQDAAFGALLRERGYLIATETVASLDDAKAVLDEMITIDLRNLPIGIPLPRWTEDGFNGDAHASMNDYMPPLGLRPNEGDRAQWLAMSDAYIEDPTDAHLFALIDGLRSMHNDGGYRAAHTTPTGNCRRYRQAGDYLFDVSLRKRRSQMITQHLLRRAVLNQETTLELPLAPLAAYTEGSSVGLNPFWSLAGEHAES